MRFKGALPLWVEEWSHDALKKRKREIGDRAFARGYQMKVYTEADRKFQHFAKVLEQGRKEGIPKPIPADWMVFSGVDLASAKRPGNVIFTAARDAQGIRRPIDIRVIQGSSPEVARQVADVWHTHHPEIIMVEDNGYQGALIEWVQDLKDEYPWWSSIQPWTTTSNKHHEYLGLPGLDLEFNNGAWSLPGSLIKGHEVDCRCGFCLWIDEMSEYPICETSDCVMACWFARCAIKSWEDQLPMFGMPEVESDNFLE